MDDEFDILESSSSSSSALAFDIKKFLFKALSYWKWFLILLAIGCYYVHYKNVREEFSYRLGTKISIEDDSNPLFTSNASLTFNWGGVTAKVQTMIVTLKSRSHHEKVVERLGLYKSYLVQGEYRKQDVYNAAPFRFNHDFDKPQLINTPIKITCIDANTYSIDVEFLGGHASVQNYLTKGISTVEVPMGMFNKTFAFGEQVDLPFLSGKLVLNKARRFNSGNEFYLQFSSFNGVVASYRGRTSVANAKGSPIVDITLIDKNKQKIVDYLNMTVTVLEEDQLGRKNQYATNAIAFIDDQLNKVQGELTENTRALNDYRRKTKMYGLQSDGSFLNEKLLKFEEEKQGIERQLNYYDNLKDYLLSSSSFTEIPAPSIAGISDANILGNVSKINQLSVDKSKLQYSVRREASVFDDLDRQIEGLKNVLLENIKAATNILVKDLRSVNTKIVRLESQFNDLPEEQQKLNSIKRKYTLSQQTYNVFLSKRGEAEIIKASNVSDILVVDSAKNTGAQVISRNLNVRYVFAFFIALLIPLLIAFLFVLLDKKIHSPSDIEKLTSIPLIGIVGKNILDNNLVVHRTPKSTVSESFRGIRSGLQFFYKQKDVGGAKTVLVTSSVSGEGKTFCSINVATVFALSGKKTILLGLDLRKPKIFGDFKIKNDVGIVNYIIGQKTLDDVLVNTEIDNLDVITSGPIPPNPSELLMGENLKTLITTLKSKYDYIVLDTPPLGLVSDALELLDYADVSLYVVRQGYSKKEMLNVVNEKYKTKQISNVSIVYNGYDYKSGYGYGNGYGYGYGYGYGDYANGYHDNAKSAKKGLLSKLKF